MLSVICRCPKTVENFCVHSRNGYYNGHIFHRVIKGFMIQTGDPLGTACFGFTIHVVQLYVLKRKIAVFYSLYRKCCTAAVLGLHKLFVCSLVILTSAITLCYSLRIVICCFLL